MMALTPTTSVRRGERICSNDRLLSVDAFGAGEGSIPPDRYPPGGSQRTIAKVRRVIDERGLTGVRPLSGSSDRRDEPHHLGAFGDVVPQQVRRVHPI